MLEFLQKRVQKSKIEKLYHFTIHEWKTEEQQILNRIVNFFYDSELVIVRSSAKDEDSTEHSSAGAYQSIMNIKPCSTDSLKSAINAVVNSYTKKGNLDTDNQILIQNQSLNVEMSGVIFTKTPDTGAPYYVINYEEGGSTHLTTSGLTNNLIKIFRLVKLSKLDKKWRLIISAINEIESILNSDSLDIEFGFTNLGQVILFQVRPLTSIPQTNHVNLEKKITNKINYNQKQFLKLNRKIPNIMGNHTVFSDMADWNPSEIIGNNPNMLDYSLYDYLIMKDAWHKGRGVLQYHNIEHYNLMVRFGNKPYVDTRGSFNSLIPLRLDKKIKKKLLKYYLQKLATKPFLHDKVEFEIVFTCYDLTVDLKLAELLKHGFTNSEINKIKKALLQHTNYIITNFKATEQTCTNLLSKLSTNREIILTKYNSSKKDYHSMLLTAEELLKDCKKYGTIPFSTMARIAFIATALLQSLVRNNHVTQIFVDNVMNSIHSPLSEFQDDLTNYHDKKITLGLFLNKYGHLRPGTYDIMALRYDKNKLYFDLKFVKPHISKTDTNEHSVLAEILEKHGIVLGIDFIDFVQKSISQREYIKFLFTRNLSDAIELIAEAGNELGFSRQEMSNLDLKSIFTNSKKLKKQQLQKLWQKKIFANNKKKYVNNYLILPPIINSVNDFEIIRYYSAKPNFLTSKSVTAYLIKQHDLNNIASLENKIVLLESADPGYDWIFTRNPAGLITKYGGIASHMSIRCAEVDLPAAIGCGEIIFERLMLASKILLDCNNKEILILEHTVHDEFVEERKVLKSLGYIK